MKNSALPVIGFFETVPGYGGGNVYEQCAIEALWEHGFDVRVFHVYPGDVRGKRPKILKRILDVQRREKDVSCWVRTIQPVIALQFSRPRGINICLMHHLDSSHNPHSFLNRFFDNLFLRNLKKCNSIVVVSEYWKKFLIDRGFEEPLIIRSGIDPHFPEISMEEVRSFLEKYGFDSVIPLVYLGNCKRGKGVVEAFEALREEPYQFLTSGKPEVKLPVPNLDLEYKDYQIMLKASSLVVAMSLFKEGWCRTAHEAMLYGTPVVGSGSGGMRELLEGGGQIICKQFEELPSCVRRALKHRVRLGQEGKEFTSTLNLKTFRGNWINLISMVTSNVDH